MDLRRPVVWLMPLVAATIQVFGATGMRHRIPDLPALTWFGHPLLLVLIVGAIVFVVRRETRR